MNELVTLAIHCVHCRRRVRLYMSEWPDRAERPVIWTCPHCYEANRDEFPGQLEFIDVADDDS